MHRSIAFGGLLACALVALTSPAFAEDSTFVEKSTAAGQDIRFQDDPLKGLTGTLIGSQFKGFHSPQRLDLMRPRWTFVPEMLKSVEHL